MAMEMKTKFKIEEYILVDLFIKKMQQYGSSRHGTYNGQDPTNWSKTEVQFFVPDGEGEPTPIDVEIDDCTWVQTITFSEFGSELAKGIWDPSEKKWTNINAPGFFYTLHNVFVHGEHQMDMDMQEDLDCMGYNEI